MVVFGRVSRLAGMVTEREKKKKGASMSDWERERRARPTE